MLRNSVVPIQTEWSKFAIGEENSEVWGIKEIGMIEELKFLLNAILIKWNWDSLTSLICFRGSGNLCKSKKNKEELKFSFPKYFLDLSKESESKEQSDF